MKKTIKSTASAEEFQDLTYSTPLNEIAELCGVTVGHARRWLSGSVPVPFAVAQLFRLRSRGVIGSEWDGWAFGTDGLLYHPQWRRGFTGHELAGMFWTCQQVRGLEYRVRELEKELHQVQIDLHRAEAQRDYLRRQVRIEGALGMALVRIAG